MLEFLKIKKDRTPKGDGNFLPFSLKPKSSKIIKKDRTPKGDGN